MYAYVLSIFLGAMAAAQDTKPVLVVTEPWPPFSYEEQGQIKGTATELVRRTLAEAGLPYEIRISPWPRTLDRARRTENTVIYSIIYTPERAKEFAMIGQVAPTDRNFFYKLKSRTDIQINSISDLKRYRTATGRSSVMHTYIETNELAVTLTTETWQAFPLLLRNRVDLVLQSERAFYSMPQLRLPITETFEPVFLAFEGRPFMALGPQHDPALANRLRAAYQALVEVGDIPTFD